VNQAFVRHQNVGSRSRFASYGSGEHLATSGDNGGNEGDSMMRLTIAIRKSTRLLRNAVVLGILGLLLLAGCHTTAGFGQDMQSVGRNLQNSANKNNR